MTNTVIKKGGFAGMNPEKARKIQSMGGKAINGGVFKDPALARYYGSLGGKARVSKGRNKKKG